MSPLQWGLWISAAALLAGLAGHSAWLDYRARRLRRSQSSVETAPVEPRALDASDDWDTPHLGSPGIGLSPGERKPTLDALIDAITPIVLENPVSGDAVLAALPATRRVGSKPFAVEGLNAGSQQWEPIAAGQRYTALQAGLQLASRAGPINDIEFSEYVMKTQALCDALGATPEFPDMRHEVARARELDQFASACDAQLGITLRARRSAWSPSFVQQVAERHGFVPGAVAGRLVLPVAQGEAPLLGLAFDTQAALADDLSLSALREVRLSLDVAHVPRQHNAFARMHEIAFRLAQVMDAHVTDDAGLVLTPDALASVAQELEQLYDVFEQHDIPTGSALARRLFS
ncbi:MAG: hypothetical protein OHK0048_04300 [Rhodoferax sp.]